MLFSIFYRKAKMTKADFKSANSKGFLRPEDKRPEHGPVYAINTTGSRIVFQGKNNLPAVTFGATPEPESIAQIEVKMLDTVEFMRLWAKGTLAVSTDSNVARVYTDLEAAKNEEESAKQNSIVESIQSRDSSSDYEVVASKTGLPAVKRKARNTEK